MTRILLGLHGGATADGAVRVAQLLQLHVNASIEAVAVLASLPVIDCGYGPVYIPDPNTEDELADQLREDCEKQLARCDLVGAKLSVVRGPRTATICDLAVARSADLIVVGIGPHHFADRALGNETALHLAQQASTPVLAVPAGMRSLPRHILVATDFSPSSLAAARLATALLTTNDTLELAHVSASAQIGSIVVGPPHIREAEHRMDDFVAQLNVPISMRVVTRVFGGEPARALLDLANRTDVDMIALGSHGYKLWERVLLGSVSSKLLRLAHCAVLIYPSRCVATSETMKHLPVAHSAMSAASGPSAKY
ncbi:MAG TPA: universal stress protein [Gemmatimonadaceae bacterium]|nr:universal stress protein [Gemmatimonadaceae bacterium]